MRRGLKGKQKRVQEEVTTNVAQFTCRKDKVQYHSWQIDHNLVADTPDGRQYEQSVLQMCNYGLYRTTG